MPFDIDRNFKPDRGDLIYGMDAGRDFYLKNSATLAGSVLKGHWVTANSFNNHSILSFSDYYTPNTPITGRATQIKMLGEHLDKIGKAEVGKPFVEALYQHYPPAQIKAMDTAQLGRNGDSHNFKMIRRSCKFGLEYVAGTLDTHAKVHFALDQMASDRDVITKKKYAGRVAITVSEMRYLFRHWDRLHNRVVFYKSLRETFAPWEVNGEAWRGYAAARYEKYMNRAKKLNIACGAAIADTRTVALMALTREANRLKKLTGEPRVRHGSRSM